MLNSITCMYVCVYVGSGCTYQTTYVMQDLLEIMWIA